MTDYADNNSKPGHVGQRQLFIYYYFYLYYLYYFYYIIASHTHHVISRYVLSVRHAHTNYNYS